MKTLLSNPSQELLQEVPARIALRYLVIPVAGNQKHLELAAPSDLSRADKEELRILLGRELVFLPFESTVIRKKIEQFYGIGADVIDLLTRDNENAKGPQPLESEIIDHDSKDDATVARLVNELLLDALKHHASDIHIEPFENRLRIRYRIDGILHTPQISSRIQSLASSLISRIKILARLDIAEKRLPQDGRIKIKREGDELDLRISVLPSSYGESIVIRILRQLALLDLKDLGYEKEAMLELSHQLVKPHGMILVTGPTGAGKTTTLYAFLKELNQTTRKIITIEDPIEYKVPGIIQIQVAPKIGLTFAQALRSKLRHDPDCLMVGEIRDTETAEIAIRCSLTGHLVFSTLHTNDAPSALTRLVEMGIEPYLAASSIECVIAQRLIRRLCSECGGKTSAVPCDRCSGTGYSGRTSLYEIMKMTDELRQLVIEKRTGAEIRRAALKHGMRSFQQEGESKIASGLTTREEIKRVIGLGA